MQWNCEANKKYYSIYIPLNLTTQADGHIQRWSTPEIIALPRFPFLASIFLHIMSLFIVLLNRWDVRAVLNEVLD